MASKVPPNDERWEDSTHRFQRAPSDRELDIMYLAWINDDVTVREMQEYLAELVEYDFAYTTVLTEMRNLTDKGMLERTLEGNTHHYRATPLSKEYRRYAARRVLQCVYNGSRTAFLEEMLSFFPYARTWELEGMKLAIDSAIAVNEQARKAAQNS
jgi:predicted transcriptional regulator